MKNLNNKKYKKVKLQTLECSIFLYQSKLGQKYQSFASKDGNEQHNLIGFSAEYYYPASKRLMCNLYNYNHTSCKCNKKLYIRNILLAY